MSTRFDFPQNARRVLQAPKAQTGTTTNDEFTDSGTEQISFASAVTYPLGISQTYQNGAAYRDKPKNAYDVRGARAVSVQISSFSVASGATVQLLGSNDSVGYSPIYLFNPATSTFINSFTIPAAGTATAPNSNLFEISNPWFQWLQVSITATDTTGLAYLTVVRRS